MESIWNHRTERRKEEQKRFPSLPGRVDTAVIGGGMAGILCARLLKDAGAEPVIFEADTIGSGQTKNTTAKITVQHGLIYEKLERTLGTEAASQYARANLAAVDEYERIVTDGGISCGFRRLPSFLYTNTESGFRKLEAERAAAKRAGIQASLVYETGLPLPVKAALKFENQAQFFPMDFLYGISGDLNVYERTPVLRVEKNTLMTDRGNVEADHVVFATHFPFMNWPGMYFARMHQERSYVLAINPEDQELDGMYYGIDEDGLSFRSAGDLLLLGGEAHRTGERRIQNPKEVLLKRAEQIWTGGFRECAFWAAQDCMTLDSVPYIGRFSKRRPEWYVATGFGKWGMTGSMVSAMAIRSLILGKASGEFQVFSPQRRLCTASMMNLLKEGCHSAKGLLTFGRPRCTHLGCRLQWNRFERTWDCPCHGSRFMENGDVIDNPAQEKIKGSGTVR